MKLTRYTAVVALGVFVVSCSSIHNIAIPEGKSAAINIPAKKVFAEQELNTWSHSDLATDSIPGMSIEKAYEFLQNKKSVPVIVAVTDSGSDITHEDLKSKVWVNKKEIAGNGKDDDKNGFIDDVHGWNFLGSTYDETLEITRLYRSLKPKYEGKTSVDIKKKDTEAYLAFKALEEDYENNLAEAKKGQEQYMQYQGMLKDTDVAMQNLTGKKEYTLEDIKGATSTFDLVNSKKEMAIRILESGSTIEEQIEQLEPAVEYYTSKVNTYYNLEFDGRAALNDDAYSMKTKVYGDNNVKDQAEDEIHGTHVSGIILADRNNSLGVQGVAENALLMAVRVVPNGDEYDKDVALGIRYAVDNGAKVINTSFGKGYSPNAEWVYDAIKYAAKNDVLIVNAAGNDAQNIDEKASYPKDVDDAEEISDNFLTIGALTRFYDEKLLADFTNYGKKSVDVFAPGHDIYNTVPGNEYKKLSGTSMASPATAGVAALIRSYYPELSASQVKHIIMNSGTLVNMEVLLPGGAGKKVKLSEISRSGRMVNAYNAVKMAEAIVNQKK
ncbi:subtilisin family serine protease [Wenyingzhuangia heitensis]|uniref:Subtilisin family serine protease n=1 Tax=Wenyingzhuangia heitensis TaxID=1487859 RepID=A0ABX0U5J7_9FLAO|nr:S8 family peptidase [Wenyingzhuangia heitensis]NIJ44033.1 subtilisin family serine protease [Wenyingzhuangia heitensis]